MAAVQQRYTVLVWSEIDAPGCVRRSTRLSHADPGKLRTIVRARSLVVNVRNHVRRLSVKSANAPFTLYSRSYNRLGANYANEPSQAALERSSQDACDVIRSTRAARWLCGQ